MSVGLSVLTEIPPGNDQINASDEGGCFAIEAWFDLLAEHGFPSSPTRFSVPLFAQDGRSAGRLHLMQDGREKVLYSLSNYYTGLFSPSGLPPGTLVDWIGAVKCLRALPGSHVLRLHPVSATGLWNAQLAQALRNLGYMVVTNFFFANWFLPVQQGGFENYWATRPSPLRHSVERGRRRLGKSGDWRNEMYKYDQPDLDEAIAAYVQVYRRSWKPEEPNPLFMPRLIRLAAQHGWLRLGVLRLNGEPVAAQLWLVEGGKAFIFKLAHVQGSERLSAGSVLTAEMMRQVMDVDGIQEVDFLSGDDAYKADWMTHRRERLALVAFDLRHPAAWVPALRYRVSSILRQS